MQPLQDVVRNEKSIKEYSRTLPKPSNRSVIWQIAIVAWYDWSSQHPVYRWTAQQRRLLDDQNDNAKPIRELTIVLKKF